MKKNLLKTLSIISFCSASAIAQPTLTASGINPVVGDYYSFKYCNYANPGNSGANQTWNLTSLTPTATANYSSSNPSSTPYASSFTSSNFSMNNSTGLYAFYNAGSSSLQNTGNASPSGTTSVVMSYSNPEDMLHFPFNMNNSYTDTWAANFVSNGINFARTGSTSVTYDGYGTLSLPNGTYNNVVRVHFVQTFQDVYTFASMTNTITYSNDEYLWYLNGNHQPIAAVYTATNSVNGTSQQGLYLNVIQSGVKELDNFASSVLAFPNPASNEINFSFQQDLQINQIELCDLSGKVVYSESINPFKISNNVHTINLNNYNDGMYFVKFRSNDGSVEIKKINILN